MIEDKGKRKNAAIYFGRSSSLKVIKVKNFQNDLVKCRSEIMQYCKRSTQIRLNSELKVPQPANYEF